HRQMADMMKKLGKGGMQGMANMLDGGPMGGGSGGGLPDLNAPGGGLPDLGNLQPPAGLPPGLGLPPKKK
ncbi:MAG: signal recognition particle protein, partial [Pseudomonadota bacterium]|nr:signal recognition particle protein [Pseudomonadota bacterium]